MSETLIIGLATVVLSALSSLTLVNWRLKALESKVDEHNKWGEKFGNFTTDIALIKQDIGYIKEKFEDKKEAQP